MSSLRKLDNWLSTYLDYTQGQESPELFHFWVGISLIASSLGRKAYLDRGYFKLYPNMYIILLAESEECAKSTAINIGVKNVLEDTEDPPMTFAQKGSTQGLIEEMKNMVEVNPDTREVIGNAEMLIVSPELGNFLGRREVNLDLVQALTALYDCPDKWRYRTRGHGWESIYNASINILGASTPQWLKDCIPANSEAGGFVSRLVFVFQRSTDRVFPFPHYDEKTEEMREILAHDLSLIGRMEGEFKFTQDAKAWYSEWYYQNKLKLIKSPETYVRRKKDTILKLCMCISAAQREDMMITVPDLRIADKLLKKVELYLPVAIAMIASSPLGESTSKVLELMRREKTATHSRILQKLWHKIDAEKLDSILSTLLAAGLIEVEAKSIKQGRRYKYVNTEADEIATMTDLFKFGDDDNK